MTLRPIRPTARCEAHGAANLGPAESFVHALGSAPEARLRLEVLKMHHFMIEDYPKKVRGWEGGRAGGGIVRGREKERPRWPEGIEAGLARLTVPLGELH